MFYFDIFSIKCFHLQNDPHWLRTQKYGKKERKCHQEPKNEVTQFSQLYQFFFLLFFFPFSFITETKNLLFTEFGRGLRFKKLLKLDKG